jgi:hypothetical protein
MTESQKLNANPIESTPKKENTVLQQNRNSNSATLVPTNMPTAAPTSVPASQPTATPKPDNTPSLPTSVPNANFEDAAGGWAAKWSKSNDDFSLDTNSQGNSGANSVRLSTNGSLSDLYMFSERFDIDSAATYKWSTYIKATGAVTNFNFYVDEYNTWGDWIATVWLGKMNTDYNGTLSFSYTPSTNRVRSARLQYVSTAGNTTDAYFDSVSFSKQ